MLTLSAALEPGSGFTCSASSCSGIGAVNQNIFTTLQRNANALAAKLGLKDRVSVDGKIGDKTVELVTLIAISVPDGSVLSNYSVTTKEQVARDAVALLTEMGRLVDGGASPSLPTGTQPSISVAPTGSRPPSATLPGTFFPQAGSVAPQVAPQAGSQVTSVMPPILVPVVQTKYLVGGLVAGAAVLLGGLALAMRSKKSGSAAMAGADDTEERMWRLMRWAGGSHPTSSMAANLNVSKREAARAMASLKRQGLVRKTEWGYAAKT